jgi:WD40 repeat protein
VLVTRIERHSSALFDVAFSPDGARFATATSGDGGAQIWDVNTGEEIARIEGHGDAIINLAFSPDAARLVPASEKSAAWIWDASTGVEITRIAGYNSDFRFSPDGIFLATSFARDDVTMVRLITSGTHDDELRNGVPPGDIFRIACTWLPWVNGQPDYSLTEIADTYDILIDEPICNYESGYDPPLPMLDTD